MSVYHSRLTTILQFCISLENPFHKFLKADFQCICHREIVVQKAQVTDDEPTFPSRSPWVRSKSRRILRMNKHLEREIGEKLVEKRGVALGFDEFHV